MRGRTKGQLKFAVKTLEVIAGQFHGRGTTEISFHLDVQAQEVYKLSVRQDSRSAGRTSNTDVSPKSTQDETRTTSDKANAFDANKKRIELITSFMMMRFDCEERLLDLVDETICELYF
jgi:hypothetical protein